MKQVEPINEYTHPTEKFLDLFVYGTLQRPFGNHDLITDAGGIFIGEAETVEKYPLIGSGIPYLIDSPNHEYGHHVRGEVYTIAVKNMSFIDRLEGHPRWYERRVRRVKLVSELQNPFGDSNECWMYFLKNCNPDDICESDTYADYKSKRLSREFYR